MRPRYAYSSIASRPFGRWSAGPGLAVYVAVAVEAYRPAGSYTEDLLPGIPDPDLVNTAWRDYGNRVGAFRLLDCLESHGIPPTLLLNTMVYDEAPAVTEAARAVGCEFVGHGVSNSDSLAEMTVAQERAYVEIVARRVEVEEGKRPGGWSSPWLHHTDHTLDALATSRYRYILDLRPDDEPVWLHSAAGPLLAIPYALELNDSSSMIGRQVSAPEFAEMVVDEFEELLAAAESRPIVMSIVLHSFISGVPFRLRHVRRALAHIASRAENVWFAQPEAIYAAFTALSPPDLTLVSSPEPAGPPELTVEHVDGTADA
jgi:hypothetical protein